MENKEQMTIKVAFENMAHAAQKYFVGTAEQQALMAKSVEMIGLEIGYFKPQKNSIQDVNPAKRKAKKGK